MIFWNCEVIYSFKHLQGERLLSAVVSQGLPTIPTFLLADVGEKNLKKLNEVKKSLLKNIEKKFPDVEKLYSVNNSQVIWFKFMHNLLNLADNDILQVDAHCSILTCIIYCRMVSFFYATFLFKNESPTASAITGLTSSQSPSNWSVMMLQPPSKFPALFAVGMASTFCHDFLPTNLCIFQAGGAFSWTR